MTDDDESKGHNGNFPGLVPATRDIWNANADWWDAQVGDAGLELQRVLVDPGTERLLAVRPGEALLDLACGNGAFARRMAARGARVLALDVSERLIELARRRSLGRPGQIEYRCVDLAEPVRLRDAGLASGAFDAAVCSMALFDMPAIDPLADALAEALRPGGRFVFSLTHPCFNSAGVRKTLEEQIRDGRMERVYGVTITEYLRPSARRGIVGLPGQPEPHYYFDRPLSVVFPAFFRRGFVLDALEEPAYPEGMADGGTSWRNYTQIPPVLLARMCRPPRDAGTAAPPRGPVDGPEPA